MYTGRVSTDGVGTVSPRPEPPRTGDNSPCTDKQWTVFVSPYPGNPVPPRSKGCPGCRHTKLVASRHAPRRNRPYLVPRDIIQHPAASLPSKPVKTHEIGKVLLDAGDTTSALELQTWDGKCPGVGRNRHRPAGIGPRVPHAKRKCDAYIPKDPRSLAACSITRYETTHTPLGQPSHEPPGSADEPRIDLRTGDRRWISLSGCAPAG